MEQQRTTLADRLVEAMQRMSVQMRSRPPLEWSDLELTMPQTRTLSHLSDGPRRMREIAAFLGVGMPSATSMIDRLVKKGLVERLEDSADRRVVACRLTDRGVDAVERFWRISRIRAESIADTLTVDELESVVPALELLAGALGRQDTVESRGDVQESNDPHLPVAAKG